MEGGVPFSAKSILHCNISALVYVSPHLVKHVLGLERLCGIKTIEENFPNVIRIGLAVIAVLIVPIVVVPFGVVLFLSE